MNLSEEKAIEIDESVSKYAEGLSRKRSVARKGYCYDLFLRIQKLDKGEGENLLARINPWRNERNHLIHGLLGKTVTSSEESRRRCAIEGSAIAREADNILVKPFKKNNRLRKKYNIQ